MTPVERARRPPRRRRRRRRRRAGRRRRLRASGGAAWAVRRGSAMPGVDIRWFGPGWVRRIGSGFGQGSRGVSGRVRLGTPGPGGTPGATADRQTSVTGEGGTACGGTRLPGRAACALSVARRCARAARGLRPDGHVRRRTPTPPRALRPARPRLRRRSPAAGAARRAATSATAATSDEDARPATYAVPTPASSSRRCSPPTCWSPAAGRSRTTVRAAVADVPGVARRAADVAGLAVGQRPHADHRGRRPRRSSAGSPPIQSARADEVWKRVAGGEIAVDPSLPRRLEDPQGLPPAGHVRRRPAGAHRRLRPAGQADLRAVINDKRGEQLGMPARQRAAGLHRHAHAVGGDRRSKKAVGSGVTMQILALEFDNPSADRGPVRQLGHERGRHLHLHPAPRRHASPPTRAGSAATSAPSRCRSSARDLQQGHAAAAAGRADRGRRTAGWPARSTPGSTAAATCPRFIASDPAQGALAALLGDGGRPQRARATCAAPSGEMDRRVVAIFKKWGFAWGGDWNYTDPMHFEMAKVVGVR